MSSVTVPLDHLNRIVNRALLAIGLTVEEAAVVRDVLMYAQKRGSDQGLIKIRERTVVPDPDCSGITTHRRSPAIASIDGGGHTGMFVMNHATGIAKDLIRTCGIALVNTRNTRSSTGAIGYYARQLADDGFIALVLAGSPKVMAVEGGIDPVMGTNPIAIAIPTGNTPLVLDMATAASTWFAIINARDNNQPLPDGVALDCHGNPTTSPVLAMSGALRTIAGAKGSGLALMFEMLTAPLGGASIAGDQHDNRANTIIAIDPAIVLGDNSFIKNADQLIERIKSGRIAQGHSEIRLPGQQSDAAASRCEQLNAITLDRSLYKHIQTLSEA